MTHFRTHWLLSGFGSRGLGRPGGWRSVLTWWLLIPLLNFTQHWGFCHVFINARMKASSRLLFTFHWCPVTVSLADAVEWNPRKPLITSTGLECSSASWTQEKEHQGGWKSIKEDGRPLAFPSWPCLRCHPHSLGPSSAIYKWYFEGFIYFQMVILLIYWF